MQRKRPENGENEYLRAGAATRGRFLEVARVGRHEGPESAPFLTVNRQKRTEKPPQVADKLVGNEYPQPAVASQSEQHVSKVVEERVPPGRSWPLKSVAAKTLQLPVAEAEVEGGVDCSTSSSSSASGIASGVRVSL